MKVKTLKAHNNHFGGKYSKKVGDIYDHPTPMSDLKFGYVAEVKAEEKPDDKSKSGSDKKTA